MQKNVLRGVALGYQKRHRRVRAITSMPSLFHDARILPGGAASRFADTLQTLDAFARMSFFVTFRY